MSTDLLRDAHTVMLAAFRGTRLPDWVGDAYASGLGGICLYGDNATGPEGLAPLAREVSALDPTAILATDEEGGDVTRLHMATGSPAPGNAALGIVDDVVATFDVAAGIGAELREAGIWLDLAPSADVASNPANPVIGPRSFGADPDLVARHTLAFVEGLAASGVAASVKHFPGHGDTTADSHVDLPRVDAPRDVLEGRELVPFRAAIHAGVATVMTSHVLLDALDPHRPATLSPAVLTGLLRDELAFDGVIVTDALDMAGASRDVGIGGAAVASLRAGADLLCLGPEPSDDPRHLQLAVRSVVDAVTDGTLARERLSEAATRVRALTSTWADRTPRIDADLARERGADASRRIARDVVSRLDVGSIGSPITVIRVDAGTNPAIGDTTWGRLDLPGQHVVDVCADALGHQGAIEGNVVVVVRRVETDQRVWAWIDSQLAANPSTVVVDLGVPGPRHRDRPVICTSGSSPALTDAVSAALGGRP